MKYVSEIFYLSPIAFFKTIEIIFLVYSLQVPRIDMLAGIELYSTNLKESEVILRIGEDLKLQKSTYFSIKNLKSRPKNRFPLYV
jgi:hypothetical protein